MNLGEASATFNTTPVSGWDATNRKWVPNVAKGRLIVFDRFISDRSFGQRKRNFIVGGGKTLGDYRVVKLPDGVIYMVEAFNFDTDSYGPYSTIYLLHAAPFIGQLKELQTTPRASGAPGPATEVVVDDAVFVDVDRYSFIGSDNFDQIRFGVYTLILPADVTVNTDQWITVGGVDFEIKEISSQLDLTYVRAVKRGNAS